MQFFWIDEKMYEAQQQQQFIITNYYSRILKYNLRRKNSW